MGTNDGLRYERDSCLTLRCPRWFADPDFAFPLAETNLLREVKAGARPYPEVAERLEALLDELEGLSAASALPERVDRKGWDRWLADKVRTEVLNDARQG